MNALQEATEVIRAAEQRLRSLVVQAAEQGEYDHLQQLAEWAKHLNNALYARPAPDAATQAARDRNGMTATKTGNGSCSTPATVDPSDTSPGSRAAKRVSRRRLARNKKSEYPKFFREGELLVKLGWSKSEGKPYEHKAPKRVLQALAQALVRVGHHGQRFTMDRLLPLKNLDDSATIPDYQVYLALAWMRVEGLIVQHGRQGYSLPANLDLVAESERLWESLVVR